MRDQSSPFEEEDHVPLFIDPNRMVVFFSGFTIQKKGIDFKEALEPVEANLDLRHSPLVQKDRLVDTGQHGVLMRRRPGLPPQ